MKKSKPAAEPKLPVQEILTKPREFKNTVSFVGLLRIRFEKDAGLPTIFELNWNTVFIEAFGFFGKIFHHRRFFMFCYLQIFQRNPVEKMQNMIQAVIILAMFWGLQRV